MKKLFLKLKENKKRAIVVGSVSVIIIIIIIIIAVNSGNNNYNTTLGTDCVPTETAVQTATPTLSPTDISTPTITATPVPPTNTPVPITPSPTATPKPKPIVTPKPATPEPTAPPILHNVIINQNLPSKIIDSLFGWEYTVLKCDIKQDAAGFELLVSVRVDKKGKYSSTMHAKIKNSDGIVVRTQSMTIDGDEGDTLLIASPTGKLDAGTYYVDSFYR